MNIENHGLKGSEYEMNAVQLLMQLGGTAYAAWQTPADLVGKTQTADTTFQTLLQQRQEQDRQDAAASQTSEEVNREPGENTLPDDADDAQDTEFPEKELAALGAALMADGLRQIPLQVQPVQTEQAAELQGVSLEQLTAGAQLTADPASLSQENQAVPEAAQPSSDPAEVLPEGEEAGQAEAAEAAEAAEQTVERPRLARTEAPGQQNSFSALLSKQSRPEAETRQEETPEVTDSAVGSAETRLFTQTEQMPVKVGESVEVDTTAPAPEMEQALGKAITNGLEDGSQRLEIRLTPANLGTVTVEFTQSPEGALHVVLRAETPEAAKLLDHHAGALGLLLQDNSQAEVRVEVAQPQQNQQLWQQNQQQNQQNGQNQQQQQHQQRQTPQQEADSFLHQLRLGLLGAQTL